MTYIEATKARLEAARKTYEQKLAVVPDMAAAQAAIDVFRAEHAELKRRKEAEFTAAQIAAKSLANAELELAKAETAVFRALRFSEMEESAERKKDEKPINRAEREAHAERKKEEKEERKLLEAAQMRIAAAKQVALDQATARRANPNWEALEKAAGERAAEVL